MGDFVGTAVADLVFLLLSLAISSRACGCVNVRRKLDGRGVCGVRGSTHKCV